MGVHFKELFQEKNDLFRCVISSSINFLKCLQLKLFPVSFHRYLNPV
jgi:hypothetical protein